MAKPLVTRGKPTEHFASDLNKASTLKQKFVEQGMILPTQDFQAWRCKIDKLKQVVRQSNPGELHIHESKFTMGKRVVRQSAADVVTAETIQSSAVDLEGDDDDEEESERNSEEEASATTNQDKDGETVDGQNVHTELPSQSDSITLENCSEKLDRKAENKVFKQLLSASGSTGERRSVHLEKSHRVQVRKAEKFEIVTEESCLGYLYPKKVASTSTAEQVAQYGSRLGQNSEIIRNRLPAASNLQSLLTYPKQIKTKRGSVLGYGQLDYPKSIFQEMLDQHREELKQTMSIHRSQSPAKRPTASKLEQSDDYRLLNPNEVSDGVMAQEHSLNHVDKNTEVQTPMMSDDTAGLAGWEAGEVSNFGITPSLAQSAVQSTRVGGATFVTNAPSSGQLPSQRTEQDAKDSVNMISQESSIQVLPKNTQSPLKPLKRRRKNKNQSQRDIRLKRRRSTGGGYDYSYRYQSINADKQPEEHQAPLQLANLSILISNLEKSGNFVQANQEAFEIAQKKRLTSLKKIAAHKQANSALAIMQPAIQQYPIAVDSARKSSTNKANDSKMLSDSKRSFYVTDDRGNLMKVSRSTVFEISNDNLFHQMGPKLHAAQQHNMLESSKDSAKDQWRQVQQKKILQWQQATAQFRGVLGSSDTATRKTSGAEMQQAIGIPASQTNTSFSQFTSANIDLTQKSNSQMAFRYSHYDEFSTSAVGAPRYHQMNQYGRRAAGADMIVKGGQAPTTTKEHEKRLADENQARLKAAAHGPISSHPYDPNRKSNRDLHDLDPQLTVASPRKRAYFVTSSPAGPHQATVTVNKRSGQDNQNGSRDVSSNDDDEGVLMQTGSMQAVSRDIAGSPFVNVDREPIQWTMLPSSQHPSLVNDYQNKSSDGNHNLAFATESNNFTLGRDIVTAGGHPGTSSGGSRPRVSRGSSKNDGNESSFRNTTSLPSMIQNMKNQISTNQVALKKQDSVASQASYSVVGRSMSPELPKRKLSKTKDASMQHNSNVDERQLTGQTAGFGINNIGSKLMPIVIQKTSNSKQVENQVTFTSVGDYMHSQLSVDRSESLRLNQNQVANGSGSKARRKTKRANQRDQKTPIRFDEADGRTDDLGEVATVLGDANVLGLKLADEKSRVYREGSINFEDRSSNKDLLALGIHSNKSTEQLLPNLVGPKTLKSPNAASNKTEEAQRTPAHRTINESLIIDEAAVAAKLYENAKDSYRRRQPIPIQRHGMRRADQDSVTHQASHISMTIVDSSQHLRSIGNLESSRLQQDLGETERQINNEINIDEQTDDAAAANPEVIVKQPSNIVFSTVNSSEDLKLLQQINIISMQQNQHVASKKNLKKTFTYKSNAFTKKRSTIDNIQKYTEHRTAKQNNIRFNSTTISSANLDDSVEQDRNQTPSAMRKNANSFLPTMPFKQSSFARTHKAIKMLRQGPFLDNRRHDNLSGQFINLNDYAAMHGHFAPGDSRMYIRPAEENTQVTTSGGLQSSELERVLNNQSKEIQQQQDNNQFFNMTHTVQSTNNDDVLNHVTQTSFGPTKLGSAMKRQQNSYRDGKSGVSENFRFGETRKQQQVYFSRINEVSDSRFKNMSTQIDVTASAPFKRLTNDGQSLGQISGQRAGISSPYQSKTVQIENNLRQSSDQSSPSADKTTFNAGVPATSKNRANRPFSIQQNAPNADLMSDYIQTQRLNGQKMLISEYIKQERLPSHERAVYASKKMPAELNVDVQQANLNAINERQNRKDSSSNERSNGATTIQAVPRQVVIHKQQKSMQTFVQSMPNSPKADLNDCNSQQGDPKDAASFTEDNPSNYVFRKSGEMIRGAKFASQGRSLQKIGQINQSNVLTFGAILQDTEFCNQSYNMSSTAGKFMSNNEAKARQFIEKQRKRTATLGQKRMSSNRKPYKVSEKSISNLIPLPASVIDLGASFAQNIQPRSSKRTEEPELVAAAPDTTLINSLTFSQQEGSSINAAEQ